MADNGFYKVVIVELDKAGVHVRDADFATPSHEEAKAFADAFNCEELTEPIGSWAIVHPVERTARLATLMV